MDLGYSGLISTESMIKIKPSISTASNIGEKFIDRLVTVILIVIFPGRVVVVGDLRLEPFTHYLLPGYRPLPQPSSLPEDGSN